MVEKNISERDMMEILEEILNAYIKETDQTTEMKLGDIVAELDEEDKQQFTEIMNIKRELKGGMEYYFSELNKNPLLHSNEKNSDDLLKILLNTLKTVFVHIEGNIYTNLVFNKHKLISCDGNFYYFYGIKDAKLRVKQKIPAIKDEKGNYHFPEKTTINDVELGLYYTDNMG